MGTDQTTPTESYIAARSDEHFFPTREEGLGMRLSRVLAGSSCPRKLLNSSIAWDYMVDTRLYCQLGKRSAYTLTHQFCQNWQEIGIPLNGPHSRLDFLIKHTNIGLPYYFPPTHQG